MSIANKNITKIAIIMLLLVILVLPTFISAAWWNPFSWNIWQKISEIFYKPQVVQVEQQNKTEETKAEEQKLVENNIISGNNDNNCTKIGGVFCENGQCPSGPQIIDGKYCCLGDCYDTTKTCKQLGGILSSFNECNGDRVGSIDTMAKGMTDVCCIGKKENCTAEYGQLASDACSLNCDNCICPTTNPKTLIKGYSLLEREYISKNSICLNEQVSYSGKLENEGIWHLNSQNTKKCIEGKVLSPCNCGGYYCGYTRNQPWNYCENNKCLSKLENVITTNKCIDNTDVNKCSSEKPKMCLKNMLNTGVSLVNMCKECGCPTGLTCDKYSNLCYNANAETQYLFSDSDFQSVNLDGSKFEKSSQVQQTSDNKSFTFYKQDAESYKIQIFHSVTEFAPTVFSTSLNFYQFLTKGTIIKSNEYGDQSKRLSIIGNNGAELRMLLIQKGNHEIEFAYLPASESSVNNLAQLGLSKIK